MIPSTVATDIYSNFVRTKYRTHYLVLLLFLRFEKSELA